jgi:hypothetical protein
MASSADIQRTYRSSLGEYIRAQKLQKSLERLTHSDEPILNVAIALGLTPSNPSIAASSASMARRRGLAPQHGNGSIVPASRLIVGGISSGSAGLTAGECALLFLCRRLTGCRRRAFYADPDF